ncbi:tetratricopeptide repeat protein, partial [Candidatus Sumerlaeota bacterium]|nr:tetratricopeptide repeat protein [Candidatus Sumerlaeota bacterium]
KKAYEIISRRKEGGNDNIKWVEGVVRRRSPYEQTLDELIKLVEANPGHESLLYNLAYKYAEAGNVEKGIATYERVLIVNPNNEDAHHNLKVLRIQKAFGLSKAR